VPAIHDGPGNGKYPRVTAKTGDSRPQHPDWDGDDDEDDEDDDDEEQNRPKGLQSGMHMEDHDHILSRYKRMRAAGREMNSDLVKLCGDSIERAAKDLGMWVDGTVVMADIDKSCVLMDYAIYDCREGGLNAVDRHVAKHPPAPGSDAEMVLAAKKRAFFSVFQVREIVEGIGVRVTDILRRREHFLADVGFSQTAVEGIVFASRVLPFEDFIMTTGAAVPVDADVLEGILECLDDRGLSHEDMRNLPREAFSEYTAMVLRACLGGSGDQQITYQDIPGSVGVPTLSKDPACVGRNDPCPCGSGRKYKKCCGG